MCYVVLKPSRFSTGSFRSASRVDGMRQGLRLSVCWLSLLATVGAVSLCLTVAFAQPAGKRPTAKSPAVKPSPAKADPFYEARVIPYLKQHCFDCHGAQPKPKGDIALNKARSSLDLLK